ncbi:MAG: hypothetical protein J0L77_09795 [Alphaproteobacteria bacterium]|nr:hypothetical protein [Alphaproteobacteria bacterium]
MSLFKKDFKPDFGEKKPQPNAYYAEDYVLSRFLWNAYLQRTQQPCPVNPLESVRTFFKNADLNWGDMVSVTAQKGTHTFLREAERLAASKFHVTPAPSQF